MFCYDLPMLVQQPGQPCCNITRSVLLSPRNQRFALSAACTTTSFIAVRFRVGALRHFCAIPVGKLIDQTLSAQDLWGKAGHHIETSLKNAETLTQRIQMLDAFLWQQWQKHHKTEHAWFDRIIELLYYQQTLSLDELIHCSPVSTRYFQKVFKHNAGVSPKYFQRIARMEVIVKQLLLLQEKHYLYLALERGYFDQAHFIKDFKQLCGDTPSHFLQEKNFRTHFYNPSMPA